MLQKIVNRALPKREAHEVVVDARATGNGLAVLQLRSHSRAHAVKGGNPTFRLAAVATCQEVRKVVGLLLASARVERQQVVKDGSISLRSIVNVAWWVEPGLLIVNASVPAGVVIPGLGSTAKNSPIAEFELFDDHLFDGALADTVGVAAALQLCLYFVYCQGEGGAPSRGRLKVHGAQHCCCRDQPSIWEAKS